MPEQDKLCVHVLPADVIVVFDLEDLYAVAAAGIPTDVQTLIAASEDRVMAVQHRMRRDLAPGSTLWWRNE